jgi:hypothetical protein
MPEMKPHFFCEQCQIHLHGDRKVIDHGKHHARQDDPQMVSFISALEEHMKYESIVAMSSEPCELCGAPGRCIECARCAKCHGWKE